MTISSTEVQHQLEQLGLAAVRSIDDLLKCWSELTPQQREQGYFLLAREEEESEQQQAALTLRDYDAVRDRRRVASLQKHIYTVTNDPSLSPDFSVDGGFHCTVAAWNGKVVGYALFERDQNDTIVHEIVVSPRYRGQGIMSSLFQSLQGEGKLNLLVHAHNGNAKEAFGRFGFVQEGTTPNGYLYFSIP